MEPISIVVFVVCFLCAFFLPRFANHLAQKVVRKGKDDDRIANALQGVHDHNEIADILGRVVLVNEKGTHYITRRHAELLAYRNKIRKSC